MIGWNLPLSRGRAMCAGGCTNDDDDDDDGDDGDGPLLGVDGLCRERSSGSRKVGMR